MHSQLPEPWLRGTLPAVAAVQRAVLHALELARQDLHAWCALLSDAELNRTHDRKIASVAFQLRHIAGSIDRLLTYAEGKQLSAEQLAFLKTENEPGGNTATLLLMVDHALDAAAERVRAFSPQDLEQPRSVGKKQLPTTLGGLLVHVADHTQRHVGQAIVTAKLARA